MELIDLTDPDDSQAVIDQLHKIISLLNCSLCDKIFSSPVALDCAHRFCEPCLIAWKNLGHLDCHVCHKVFSIAKRFYRPQSQLKMYINNFTKLVEIFSNNYKLPDFSAMHDYAQSKLKLSELKNHSNLSDENDKTLTVQDDFGDITFLPTSNSTVMKSNVDLIRCEQTILFDKANIVDETLSDVEISRDDSDIRDQHTNNVIDETANLITTTIEPSSLNSQNFTDYNGNSLESSIHSVAAEKSSIHVPFVSPMSTDKLMTDVDAEIDLILDTSDDDFDPERTYQTQSQYHVRKQAITYTHKIEDKFDRVIRKSNADISIGSTHGDASTSSRGNRSSSPEMLFENDFSDDSLMDSIF